MPFDARQLVNHLVMMLVLVLVLAWAIDGQSVARSGAPAKPQLKVQRITFSRYLRKTGVRQALVFG